jgi:hypothetical protein
MNNLLLPGQQLNINDRLMPPTGRTVLTMQSDGNLVLYRVDNGSALWSSNTCGQPVTHAIMQADGNFVCYDANGHAHWATGTNGNPGAQLLIQDDGNLVVYGPRQIPLWASNTVQTWPPAVPVTQSPATPVPVTTVPVTVTVTPGVAITGTPSNPSISLPPTTPPPSGIALVGARGSLFSSGSDMSVINLERAIRQQTGLTDNNQLRAAIYAKLVAIATASNRTPDEQAVADWLAQQVKNTRVEAARLALAEHDKWNYDPWDYRPPEGYGFPTYAIPARGSIWWATSTPNPPVLADTSWQSFFADIVSNNGWSPLNNPLLTKGQTSTSKSIENMIGFPAFGTALAYQKLYGSADGARVFAETSAYLLGSQSFDLAALLGGPAAQTVRLTYLQQIAPYSYRNLNALVPEILKIGAGRVPVPTADNPSSADLVKSLGNDELLEAARAITVGEALGNFVATFVLSVALQALIGEVTSLITKVDLRTTLTNNLSDKQSAQLPDLSNLFYYDMGHVDPTTGQAVWYLESEDDQPTDPVGLERRMGSAEAHRAFLLATL